MSAVLELQGVHKTYQLGKQEVEVLQDINLQIGQAEMVAVMGPSGSGKSTLMNIMGLLDRPNKGSLKINGEEINLSMSDATLARLRSEKIGFVFQSFHLLPRLTAVQNVLLPTMYRKTGRADRFKRAQHLLEQLGLEDRLYHRPAELSGGEKQRVAIARSLINDPEIILADEPTGNLDSQSGREVMKILKRLNQEGKTVIVITHDQSVAAYASRTIQILDGHVQHQGGHYV